MRKLALIVAMVCMCSFAISTAWAGEGCSGSKNTKMTSGGCPFSGKACAGEADAFPTMVRTVGEKSFECPIEAAKAAKANHGKVMYVVAGTKFDCEDKAMQAYACAAECYAKRFTSISCEVDGKWVMCSTGCSKESATCAKSAKASAGSCCMKSHGEASMTAADAAKCKKFRVAGRTYTKFDDAKRAAEAAHDAIKSLKIAYRVKGKMVASEGDVCPMAKKAGEVEYVIGKEATPCEYTAKVKLAKAQVEAAKHALESMARA